VQPKLNRIRRGQFITPFGPGALHVLRNGISVITAGLDHWYETSAGVRVGGQELVEFRIEEWRLQRELNVDYFMIPPEFRIPGQGPEIRNALLKIPVLRFPKWYSCPQCGRMKEENLEYSGYVSCTICKRRMTQVRFIAMCDNGHIQDFPWTEWVHRSASPLCLGPLRYSASGGGSLHSIKITCLSCLKERTLENVTGSSKSTTYLSSNLLNPEGNRESGEAGTSYLCRGRMPWHGKDKDTECNLPIRAALRNATNVYYADIKSSIYLPPALFAQKNDTLETLRTPEIKAYLNIMKEDFEPGQMVRPLRKKYGEQLKNFTDGEIEAGVGIIWGLKTQENSRRDITKISGEDRWIAFRRMEYKVLSSTHRDDDLITKPVDLSKLSSDMRKRIERILLVEKLRETRVLTGFTRVNPENNLDPLDRQVLLWRKKPENGRNWLPASIVFGEGIFIQLQENVLREWEEQTAVRNRAQILDKNYKKVSEKRGFKAKSIVPRFILLHTLAHLLINRLTYESGYSSASLRERLYVSDNLEAPMSGVLIYTSSGDSEGTLGGLVRMGKPENFEPLFRRALERASWCSADPVCSEMGDLGGQGPDSCNLAACHNCCLVAETSCEEFNRFLDRTLAVANDLHPEYGFFKIT
jgi:hypothetical protein